MNVACNSKSFLTRFFTTNPFALYRINGFRLESFKLTTVFRKETSYQLHTRARKRLERIHKKNEDVVARSQEALKKLRRKKLEGLSENKIPEDIQLGERLLNTRSIRRLLSIYNATKDSKVLSVSNQVITLKRIAEQCEKYQDERVQMSKRISYQKLVCELINNVSDVCDQCTSRELVDIIVALTWLDMKHFSIFGPMVREIHVHGFEKLSAEEIGLLCWALGVLADDNAYKTMEEIGKQLYQRELVTFSNMDLCRIAWSFSELSVPADTLLKEICSELLTRDLSLFEPKAITHMSLAFSRIDSLADHVMQAMEDALYSVIETKKYPTEDLVYLTVSFLRCNRISRKMFSKLDKMLIFRRDFEETVSKELLEELLMLLKESSFHMSEIRKVLENVLYPSKLNSVFDVFFRPRASWKAKLFKQYLFKEY
ncbi:uncharacterized protein LOC116291824 [Actinia tenebrosa]|uniref:Uncharacterized protein LOC116291824 n=1 Tax=Actinia tenebrosa TaxID=6105 RepID=A0A6P8HJ72_ACTTE|nr:uncharacterized protein LOC116291824 [Actinia tenebrosa]